jgi:hypothetical protein
MIPFIPVGSILECPHWRGDPLYPFCLMVLGTWRVGAVRVIAGKMMQLKFFKGRLNRRKCGQD